MVKEKPRYSCYGCDKRTLGCHSACSNYTSEKAKAQELKQIKANSLFYEIVYRKYVLNKKGATK